MRKVANLLFLDIDGVLNVAATPDNSYQDGQARIKFGEDPCRLLNIVVRDTGCRVVISSSWRYMMIAEKPAMTPLGFRYLLKTHGVILGRDPSTTPSDEEIPERVDQILHYVAECNVLFPVRFAVFDDCPLEFPEDYHHHFLHCESDTGITKNLAEYAINFLSTAEPYEVNTFKNFLKKPRTKGMKGKKYPVVRCLKCKQLVAGRLPVGGHHYPRLHRPCDGHKVPAELIQEEMQC